MGARPPNPRLKAALQTDASPARAGWVERWLASYAALALRRPWWLVLLGFAAFCAAAPAAVLLYTDLRTDLRELLPRGAPAAVALDALERRVGGLSHLSVVIQTDDLPAGERFADALAARLQRLVPSEVREVRHRTDEERAYRDAHGALHADVKDLEDLDEGLRAEKIRQSPFDLDLDDDPRPAGRDPRLERAARDLRRKLDAADPFVDGYLAGEGGHTLVLLVTSADAAVSLEADLRLFGDVDGEVRALDPKSFHPSIRVGYDGEVREVIEAQQHLVHDIEVSGVLVLGAVALVIVIFYRSARALPLLCGPLFTGVALAFAAGRVAIGYLNPNTAFLGSIIVGNGINAGIILLARYLEERRRGAAGGAALPAALSTTWRATLTASGGAAASYGCLGVTGFRGFNQFAFMGGVGMVLVWLSTYLLMPPLLVLFERRSPLVGAGARGGRVAGPYARLIAGRAGTIVLASTLLACVAGAMLVRFAADPIEYDFTRLGSRQGAVDGAHYWAGHADAVMQSYLTPTVVLTADAEHAALVARAVQAEKDAGGAGSPIASVMTLADVLPQDQARKLALLRDIMSQLSDRVVRALPPEDRPLVERLRTRTELREVTLADLPQHVRTLFREKDGHVGRLVLVYPTLGASAAHGRVQKAFATQVRRAAERADPGAQVAGALILTADIIESITHDGLLAALLSFAAVAALTLLVMGSARDAAWVVGSLALGTLWLGGALGAFDVKLNFVNFAVLPITFGIGVDYAVNLYQRYREIGRGGAQTALAASGGAVALCSFTTILGYSALLVADNRAIFSFGLTAVLGEVTCLSAALLALPAPPRCSSRPKTRCTPEASEASAGGALELWRNGALSPTAAPEGRRRRPGPRVARGRAPRRRAAPPPPPGCPRPPRSTGGAG